MKFGSHRLHFLWEEEVAPPEEALRLPGGEPAGVPRPLRAVTRFALIGVAATSLLSQVVGVRLMAPVDASPSYMAQCKQGCQQAYRQCASKCTPGKTYNACRSSCSTAFNQCNTGCNSK